MSCIPEDILFKLNLFVQRENLRNVGIIKVKIRQKASFITDAIERIFASEAATIIIYNQKHNKKKIEHQSYGNIKGKNLVIQHVQSKYSAEKKASINKIVIRGAGYSK